LENDKKFEEIMNEQILAADNWAIIASGFASELFYVPSSKVNITNSNFKDYY